MAIYGNTLGELYSGIDREPTVATEILLTAPSDCSDNPGLRIHAPDSGVIKIGKINIVRGISGYSFWTAQPSILRGSAITAETGRPPASYYCYRAIGRVYLDDAMRLKLRSQELPFPIDRKAGDFFQFAFGRERSDDSGSKINTPDDIFIFGDVKCPGVIDGNRLRVADLCLHSWPMIARTAAANLGERSPETQQNGKRFGQLHLPILTRNSSGETEQNAIVPEREIVAGFIDGSCNDFVQGARF